MILTEISQIDWKNVTGNLISSFIFFLVITIPYNFIGKRRQKKEYWDKVERTNQELLALVRPSIAEKNFPTLEVLNALIGSLSRNHEVEKGDLLSVSDLAEELITEVMGNAFLASEQKTEFCKMLNDLKKQSEVATSGDTRVINKYKQLDIIITTFAFVGSVLVLFSNAESEPGKIFGSNQLAVFIAGFFVTLVVSVLSYLWSFMKFQRKHEEIGNRIHEVAFRVQKTADKVIKTVSKVDKK